MPIVRLFIHTATLATLFFTLVFTGCADSGFLERTKLNESILQGERVSSRSEIAKRVVLITKEIIIEGGAPSFLGICSGAVISDRIILTAAHCIPEDTQSMRVVFTPNPRQVMNSKKDVYKVIDKIIHSKYADPEIVTFNTLDEMKANPDLGLLMLDRPLVGANVLETSFFMKAVRKTLDFEDYKEMIITGYGRTTALKDTSTIDFKNLNGALKQAEIELESKPSTAPYFSLPQRGKPGVCYGDSGGPVFLKSEARYSLYAMAISVYRRMKTSELSSSAAVYNDCAGRGLYLNLNYYKDWIWSSLLTLQHRHQD